MVSFKNTVSSKHSKNFIFGITFRFPLEESGLSLAIIKEKSVTFKKYMKLLQLRRRWVTLLGALRKVKRVIT